MSSPEFLTLDQVPTHGRRVLVRVDFNVPLSAGRVADDTRMRASLPVIRELLRQDAAVLLMSHLGRPTEGEFDGAFSLQPVADHLSQLLRRPVPLLRDWTGGVDVSPGAIVMLENVRFERGEKKNDDALARRMAALCDVYVNDAFATAHRAQSSTHGVAKYAPVSCAGPLLAAEVQALSRVMHEPARPLLAVVGGAKVSGKLSILDALLGRVDQLIVGGGIANTFLLAAGHAIGGSLHEPGLVADARAMIERARGEGRDIPLPVDVVCAKAFSADAPATVKPVTDLAGDDLIMDIGPETAARYRDIVHHARTIVWNGPLGVFEFEQFAAGTRALADAIADSGAFSVAGGGDTLAAVARFGVADRLSYISTGGGAFLEFIEGKTLPAIAILEEAARARAAAEREY